MPKALWTKHRISDSIRTRSLLRSQTYILKLCHERTVPDAVAAVITADSPQVIAHYFLEDLEREGKQFLKVPKQDQIRVEQLSSERPWGTEKQWLYRFCCIFDRQFFGAALP